MQIKADLIRQREVEILKPSAGPGSSEILHLLRPSVEDRPAVAVEAEKVEDRPAVAVEAEQPQPGAVPQHFRWRKNASASFCASTETLVAAAEAVFGRSGSQAASAPAALDGGVVSAASETLLGLSCAISKSGEVNSGFEYLHNFRAA